MDDFTGIRIRANLDISVSDSHESFVAKPGEIQRLRNTKAYELFEAGKKEEITKDDFNGFVRIDEYFKDKAKERRLALIDNIATLDKDVESLWIYLKERFVA